MKCPIDNTELKVLEREHVVGQVCTTCQGIFLDKKTVAAFKQNFASDVLQSADKNLSIKSNRMCPCCKTAMHVTYIEATEIDICTNCSGIWFDQSEIGPIVYKYRQNPGTKDYWLLDIISNFSP